jgi:hypothetical protein
MCYANNVNDIHGYPFVLKRCHKNIPKLANKLL